MSDLQLGLVILGLLVVAAVVLYNKWQERKLGRHHQAAFGSRHEDVLLREPAVSTEAPTEPVPALREPSGAEARVEHTLGDEPASSPPAAISKEEEPSLAAAVLDPAVDYIIELSCGRPIQGSELATHAQSLIDEGMIKPVHWEGYEEERNRWGPVSAERRYLRARVGLQLTNRAGPVTEEHLLAFCASVQEVALALAATAETPDTDAALACAQALDRFCADVDVQIGLSVIGSESHVFSGSKIRALAESFGLAIGRDGRFHRHAEDGLELFALANVEPMPFQPETIKTLQTRAVTVLFDVPRVPASPSAFRRFLEFAHQLEQTLGGMLVDDNRRPIGQAALEEITHQLDRIHRTMAARAIPAGGQLALRLFS
jgi:FtsZ-interacting cell division protein ZipA